MERYSILDPSTPPVAPKTAMPARQAIAPAPPAWHPPEAVRFPAEDGGRSLADTAQNDLEAALQLLVERARYITGAMAVSVALRQDEQLICRATTGAPAQKVGSRLLVTSGLATECIRTRRILRCGDASQDSRANPDKCAKYGIAAVMLMPLVKGQEVVGVFELLSGNPSAFEERDLTAMQRLGEMIETAVEHADTAAAAPPDLFVEEEAPPTSEGQETVVQPAEPQVEATPAPEAETPPEAPLFERGSIGSCQSCGFPISGQRRLCVDCEGARPGGAPMSAPEAEPPAFLADVEPVPPQKSWLRSHGYTIATLILAGLTAALLWLRIYH